MPTPRRRWWRRLPPEPRPDSRATSSTGRSRDSSSSRARSTRRLRTQAPGRLTGLLTEPTVEGARAHLRVPGQPLHRELFVEVLQRPLPGRGGREVVRRRHLPVDELRLAALAPRRHHAVPGDGVGHLRAVIGANDVQAQVDSRGEARRREHVAVVDEQHVLVEQHIADAAGACRRRTSNAWSPAARRAGPPRRARTRRCRSTPAGCRAGSAPTPPTPSGDSTPSMRADGNRVPGITTVSAVASTSGPAAGSRSKPVVAATGPRVSATGHHVVERIAVGVGRVGEQRRRDRGVETHHRRQQQDGDAMHADHSGMFLTNGVIHATSQAWRDPRQ